jgi:excinuclease ABC subunit C
MPDFRFTAVINHEEFHERIKAVPQTYGVYVWRDSTAQVLYVGKSKSLRDRMQSYFNVAQLSNKNRRMVAKIADFSIITTNSELEALLLEMNLIKQHRPRYNVLLKDDRSYPYIKVTIKEAWPRILTTRTVYEDGARYFGPYAKAGSVRRTLSELNRLFAFRPPFDCGDDRFKRHQRTGKPCLYYEMRRCLGPCVPALVSQEEYKQTIQSVCRFLEGKTEDVVKNLRTRMTQHAKDMQFERAAFIRDQIRDIEEISQRQQVMRTVTTDQDVIAFAREDGSAVVQIFYIRNGKLIGAEPFALQNTEDEDDAQLLSSFLTQFYDSAAEVPPNIILAEHVEEPMIIENWLSQKRGHKVEISVPRRGEKRELVEMATTNAKRKLAELRAAWMDGEKRSVVGLRELATILNLSDPPTRIECFDVSNTQGTNTVGAMTVFENGEPKKANYRKFRIKTIDAPNDVGSIKEMVERRFKRAAAAAGEDVLLSVTDVPDEQQSEDAKTKEQEAWSLLPDLILIDGGIGQLNAAVESLQRLGFGHIPIAGVVKGPNRDRFDLLLPNAKELIVLERSSPVLGLVQTIDEETDRFAKNYHRTLRAKSMKSSTLEEIAGIGPKRRQLLLKTFGSLDAIRAASVDEIAALPGMTRKSAEELKSLL